MMQFALRQELLYRVRLVAQPSNPLTLGFKTAWVNMR